MTMADLLVRLYDLPAPGNLPATMDHQDIVVRRGMACEKYRIIDWVRERFGEGWAGECDVAFARQPIACLIAVVDDRMAGFACYDCTCLNFFGPIGIDPAWRQKGVGRAVLLATLQAMAHIGYAYAIIGGAGPVDFFKSCVDALPIPGSTPGIYPPMLKDR